jgi:acetyl-CoA acetyltransferase/uncharacterized OB-fold protein
MIVRVPVCEGLFALDDEPRLLGSECEECGQSQFPRGSSCLYCGAEVCFPVELAAKGRLVLHTAVLTRPPGYRGEVPFGFGVVELEGGTRVVSRLTESAVSRLHAQQPMRLVLVPLHADEEGREVVTYAFTSDPEAAGSGGAEVGGRARRTRPTPPEVPIPPAAAPGGRAVEIAGVGLHPFGRFADEPLTEIGAEAVRLALRDAEIDRRRIQAAYCASVYGGVAAGHKVLTSLGLTGMPIVNVEAGCASGGAALIFGVEAIRSGRYDTVLVLGMEKMPRGIIRSSFFEPWREEAGLAVTPAYFALRAQRLMRESGVTREDLARVSVKNHRNGVDNPYAMYRKEISLEAVLESAVVCEPLTLYMFCSPNEGAAAIVLRAGGKGGVRVAAAALRSHLPGGVLGEHTPLCGRMSEPPGPTELAARDAYEAAGIGPADIDVVELQDTDAARELLSYEELGLCPRGESAAWLRQGRTGMSGSQPVNPSGGLLSKGEPLGASALGQVVELTWQLRGTADPRQVRNARTALAHTVGRGANACVIVLKR